MSWRRLHTSLFIMATLALAGCGRPAPATAPAVQPTPPLPPAAAIENSLPAGTALLAVADVSVHLDDLSYELNHLTRSTAAFGDTFPGLLLSPYLGSDPCSTCLRLSQITLDPVKDLLTVQFGIRHPFPAIGAQFPRADLDAFDVKGIMLLPEPPTGAYTFNTQVASGVPVRGDVYSLVNADGYTSTGRNLWTDMSFLNPAWPTEQSTLNPFKFFQTDGLERRFRQGQGFEYRDFTINVARTFNTVRFLLAITCNYGQPIRNKTDRDQPQYFIPEFNQKEAYHVVVRKKETAPEIVWKDATSQTFVEVLVADHQRNLSAKGAALEWDDPSNTLAAASDVSGVEVEIPALSNTIFTSNTKLGGTGTFADPYRYEVLVTNNKAASFGTYPMLAKVTDQLPGFNAYAVGAIRIPYIDDFDRENAITQTGWTTGAYQSGTGPGWSIFDSGGATGKYFDDNGGVPYENSVTLLLNSPPIDLTWSSALPVLEVFHAFDTEPLVDGGAVFLSVDGGLNFDYTRPIPVISGTGYTSELLPKFAAQDVMAYKQAFHGNSEGGTTSQFDLSAAAGKPNVMVQFVFSTNSSGSGSNPPFYQGWSIFEVRIRP